MNKITRFFCLALIISAVFIISCKPIASENPVPAMEAAGPASVEEMEASENIDELQDLDNLDNEDISFEELDDIGSE